MEWLFSGAWLPSLLLWLARVAVALLLLAFARKYVRRAREGIAQLLRDPHIPINIGPSIPLIAGEAVYIALWALLIAIALIIIGVPASYVLGGILVLVAIIAFALRESLSNLAATVMFTFFQPFRKGETIETLGHTGVVFDIELFSTVLLTLDQRLITLPSSEIQGTGIVNLSRMDHIRMVVPFLVAYGQDVESIRKTVLELMAQDARILADPPAAVLVSDLGAQGIRLTASATIPTAERLNVPNDLRASIIRSLTALDVHFPEPPAVAPPAA